MLMPRQGLLLSLLTWQAELAFATMMSFVCMGAVSGTKDGMHTSNVVRITAVMA